MKTEEEIIKLSAEMKDSLVNATGENVLILQGFLRALGWVVSDDKKEDGFTE